MIQNESTSRRGIHGTVAPSEWTERTHRCILRAAQDDSPVLISGTTGTGRELIARQIHAHSGRADHPFVSFVGGKLPAPLAAQQLFGFARGNSRLGRGAALGAVGAAQGGTLYVDEIADLDLPSQQRLFELLSTQQAERTMQDGQRRNADCDVRVIAYSSHDLTQLAAEGKFSVDLLCLLSAIKVEAMPLEQRIDHLLSLAKKAITSVE